MRRGHSPAPCGRQSQVEACLYGRKVACTKILTGVLSKFHTYIPPKKLDLAPRVSQIHMAPWAWRLMNRATHDISTGISANVWLQEHHFGLCHIHIRHSATHADHLTMHTAHKLCRLLSGRRPQRNNEVCMSGHPWRQHLFQVLDTSLCLPLCQDSSQHICPPPRLLIYQRIAFHQHRQGLSQNLCMHRCVCCRSHLFLSRLNCWKTWIQQVFPLYRRSRSSIGAPLLALAF